MLAWPATQRAADRQPDIAALGDHTRRDRAQNPKEAKSDEASPDSTKNMAAQAGAALGRLFRSA